MWTPGDPGIFWKPWMANYVAAGAFFFSEKWPPISGSPGWPTTLPQALFFFRKMDPYFWKPWMANYVAAGALFFQKNGPIFLEALNG